MYSRLYSYLLCTSGSRTLEGVITRGYRRVVNYCFGSSLGLICCWLVVGTRPVLGVSAAFGLLFAKAPGVEPGWPVLETGCPPRGALSSGGTRIRTWDLQLMRLASWPNCSIPLVPPSESRTRTRNMGSLADFRGSCLGGCHTHKVSLVHPASVKSGTDPVRLDQATSESVPAWRAPGESNSRSARR